MSIRAVGRHHGVGWHRIMGLVRAHSERVVQRRRARPCRVLLVDETSIRRRHRYVTVVACGDSGQVLAMIPGRTKASLARFFRDQGAWWCRQVEIVVPDGSRSYHPDHRTISARRPPCARQVPRSALVHPRPHPRATRDTTPRSGAASPNVRAGPVPSPLHPPAPSRSPNRSPPSTSRPAVRRPSPPPNRVRMPSSRALPTLRSRQPGPGQRNSWTLRRPLRHRPDTANTTKSSTPSSHGENRSSPTTPQDEQPTDPSKEPTTSTKSYDESPTGSPTPTITQPEESS